MNALAKYIDHTILKADATTESIEKLCEEAIEYGFYSVCVNPYYVKLCKKLLHGTDVKICCVIGFPLGASTTKIKALEAKDAIENGADEIDMVINIGALKSKKFDLVLNDIKEVKNIMEQTYHSSILKVIIETCLLTDEEKIIACKLAVEAGADFVKTSTGFSSAGATVHDIKLMKDAVVGKCKIKASGGIRTTKDFKAVISAGSDRVGASASVNIINEYIK